MAIRGFEEGIFTVFMNTVAGVGEKIGNGFRAVAESMGSSSGPSAEGSSWSIGGLISDAKDALRFGEKQQEAPVRAMAPAMEVNTPTASLGKYEVSMAELGNLAPPAVGSAVNRSTGINV